MSRYGFDNNQLAHYSAEKVAWLIKDDNIKSLEDLKIKISLGQYMDFNKIGIIFSSEFELYSIPDEILA